MTEGGGSGSGSGGTGSSGGSSGSGSSGGSSGSGSCGCGCGSGGCGSGGCGVVGVGYQGRDVEAVVGGLVAAGVAVVVDVRLTPVSRKRGFAKRALAAALAEAGIEYRHLPALGNPRPNRAGFAATGVELDRARARYAALLDRPEARAALAEIVELARSGRVALLCFEADERHCHRHVLLHRLNQATA